MSEVRVRQAVSEFVGPVAHLSRVRGGDINLAYKVTLQDGRCVFAKTHGPASEDLTRMFLAEADGLRWLANANVIRTPKVLGANAEVLVLEWIHVAPAGSTSDAQLGRGLARLHQSGAEQFGAEKPGFIGTLPQANTARSSWSEFYAECRLLPQLKLAVDSGHASCRMTQRFTQLFSNIARHMGPDESPSRLHGDLWSGNQVVDGAGDPVLIDPAAYGGHREVDLAMMRLFGGFSEHVFDAYAEQWPLAAGVKERVPLYQLYPLLVHVNLFGAGYVSAVEHALEQLLGRTR